MHLLVTIPVDESGASVSRRIRGVVTDLFASASSPWRGDYFFVRTWEPGSGLERFRVSLESGCVGPDEARDLAGRAAKAHGFAPTFEEIPFRQLASPLWNAGFGGGEFETVSKALYRAVAPALVGLSSAMSDEAMSDEVTGSYLLALRLMVANAAATLAESEQRDLPSHGFDELLFLRMLSYRSHYQAIVPRVSDPESLERRYAAYYDELGAGAREFIESCLASPPSADDPLIQAWTNVVRENFATVRGCFRDGTIVDQGLTLDDLNKGREVPLQPTRFHSFVSPELAQLLHRNPDFLAFRLHTSLLYSCLHTLGFSLVERYLFCYVLARANEDVSGRSTEELQRGLGSLARELAR